MPRHVGSMDAWYVGFDAVTSYHLGMAIGRLPALDQRPGHDDRQDR